MGVLTVNFSTEGVWKCVLWDRNALLMEVHLTPVAAQKACCSLQSDWLLARSASIWASFGHLAWLCHKPKPKSQHWADRPTKNVSRSWCMEILYKPRHIRIDNTNSCVEQFLLIILKCKDTDGFSLQKCRQTHVLDIHKTTPVACRFLTPKPFRIRHRPGHCHRRAFVLRAKSWGWEIP